MKESVTIDFAGRPLTITTGEVAKQADGSVIVQYVDTVVLVTTVAEKEESQNDFLPLTVNYQEMSYAAGKFPGGFFKREGRPSTLEVLMSRLIDRPLRPLFPKGFRNEVQVIATVLSADQENDPGMVAMIGASAATVLSGIPFEAPFAGVRVGRKDGQFLINPVPADMDESDIDIVVVGTKDALLMVEGEARFVSGSDLIEAIQFGHNGIQPVIRMQEELMAKSAKPKWSIKEPEDLTALQKEIRAKGRKRSSRELRYKGKTRTWDKTGENTCRSEAGISGN
ncbi:MAG TPA: hypothetical protein VHO84_13340 [Syntrophorhabdaceae bacterium]|nr:hypothetical protein [Syntrophorhabdaceae bacterium]